MSVSLVSRWKLRRAFRKLQKFHIAFSGPFNTPLKNRVYVINDSVLTETEIIAFFKGGLPGDHPFPTTARRECDIEDEDLRGCQCAVRVR
jgi:hypothetical protein